MRGRVLVDGAELLLMDKIEFQRTLKRRQDTPKPKSKRKIDGSSVAVAKDIPSPPIIGPNRYRMRDEGIINIENAKQKLMDRPTSKSRLDWQYDIHMPREWNDLVSCMIDYDNAQHHHSKCMFRMADSKEISAPQLFRHLYHSPEWVQQNQNSAIASTILGRNKMDDHIRALKDKFEKPKKIIPLDNSMNKERLPQTKLAKGKGKSQALTEEDYPQLRQWWHDKFADIVNSTRNQLPPWREVNHKIHLIDDNKQYKYFTPRCPNSLREELHAKVN